jgi:hypothetical protein
MAQQASATTTHIVLEVAEDRREPLMFHRIADGDGDGDEKAGCREFSYHVVARVGYI